MRSSDPVQLSLEAVARHASERFLKLAYEVGRDVALRGQPFTSADVRDEMARLHPTVVTHDDRALGVVMKRLARESAIRATGRYVTSARARNHNRPMREWVGLDGLA